MAEGRKGMCKAFSCFQRLTKKKKNKTKKSQIVLCQIIICDATLGLYIYKTEKKTSVFGQY